LGNYTREIESPLSSSFQQINPSANFATPAEPRKSKVIPLRKCNCLNEVSFAFLGMDLLFIGNLTQSSSKPLRELFAYFFAEKKVRENA